MQQCMSKSLGPFSHSCAHEHWWIKLREPHNNKHCAYASGFPILSEGQGHMLSSNSSSFWR
jgi:hypothetical protein